MSLTNAQFIKAIASDIGFSQEQTCEVFEILLNIMASALAKGDNISISGFGKFYIHEQKKRKIKHPLTGKIVTVGPKKTIRFKPFKFFRKEINGIEFDFDEFKRQNKKILQQLYALIENSGDYEDEEEEDAV